MCHLRHVVGQYLFCQRRSAWSIGNVSPPLFLSIQPNQIVLLANKSKRIRNMTESQRLPDRINLICWKSVLSLSSIRLNQIVLLANKSKRIQNIKMSQRLPQRINLIYWKICSLFFVFLMQPNQSVLLASTFKRIRNIKRSQRLPERINLNFWKISSRFFFFNLAFRIRIRLCSWQACLKEYKI